MNNDNYNEALKELRNSLTEAVDKQKTAKLTLQDLEKDESLTPHTIDIQQAIIQIKLAISFYQITIDALKSRIIEVKKALNNNIKKSNQEAIAQYSLKCQQELAKNQQQQQLVINQRQAMAKRLNVDVELIVGSSQETPTENKSLQLKQQISQKLSQKKDNNFDDMKQSMMISSICLFDPEDSYNRLPKNKFYVAKPYEEETIGYDQPRFK